MPAVSGVERRGLDRIEQVTGRVSPVDADVALQDAGDVPDAMDALHHLLEERRPVRRRLDAWERPGRRHGTISAARVDPIGFRYVSGPHSITSLAVSRHPIPDRVLHLRGNAVAALEVVVESEH